MQSTHRRGRQGRADRYCYWGRACTRRSCSTTRPRTSCARRASRATTPRTTPRMARRPSRRPRADGLTLRRPPSPPRAAHPLGDRRSCPSGGWAMTIPPFAVLAAASCPPLDELALALAAEFHPTDASAALAELDRLANELRVARSRSPLEEAEQALRLLSAAYGFSPRRHPTRGTCYSMRSSAAVAAIPRSLRCSTRSSAVAPGSR